MIMASNKNFSMYILAFFIVCVFETFAIQLVLPGGQKRCLKEEIHKDVLVTGDYGVSEVPMHKISLNVIDSKGHLFYTKEEATKGKFAFTTDEFDMFQICFESHVSQGAKPQDAEVALIMKRGVEAKNYADIAKAEKLKPMEVELKRLEDLSESIVNDFAYMRAREEEMRDTNESTHSRVFYFSIFSMACLLGLAVWQVLYLRKYFKSKKLIE